MIRGALLGIGLLIAISTATIFGVVRTGYAPMGADAAPLPFERELAMDAVHRTAARGDGSTHLELPPTDAHLSAGLKIYVQNCAMCHGTSDGRASNVAAGLSVRPPQLATDGAEDDTVSATRWKIAHGIRFTGMPAFRATLTPMQIDEVTSFVHRMDALPPQVRRRWRLLPRAGTQTVRMP